MRLKEDRVVAFTCYVLNLGSTHRDFCEGIQATKPAARHIEKNFNMLQIFIA